MAAGLGSFLTVAMFAVAVGCRRRYPGALPVLLGGVALVAITITSCQPAGPGPAGFTVGIALSVGLGWLGYRVQRSAPPAPTPSLLAAALASPLPSARAIRPEDVWGSWQFYIDAAASTVTVDFQADGDYRQTIVSNRGERVDGPGGTWTLDGPHLELDSYRSVLRAVTERVRWLFGDWDEELVLFVTDDPRSDKTFLGLRRRR